MAAEARALAAPGLPPQAPQSNADWYRLFIDSDAWPASTTSGANWAMPIIRTEVSAIAARSSSVNASAIVTLLGRVADDGSGFAGFVPPASGRGCAAR